MIDFMCEICDRMSAEYGNDDDDDDWILNSRMKIQHHFCDFESRN